VTALVALSLLFPLGASAGPPDGRLPPGTVFAVAPPGLICPEATGEVTWTIVDGQYSVVNKPGGRRMEGMGTAHMKVASGTTGKFVVLDISGAGSGSPVGDDLFRYHFSGKMLWGFFPGDAGPGDRTAARSYYFVGTTTTLVAADGTGLEFSYSGKIVMDVCAAIS
jgi:hypothetical protein